MKVAVLDARVLYPPSLCDLLMWLAATRTYAPRVTEEIHGEWIRNVLADNPAVTPAQLDRTRRLMNQVTPECLVSGYEARVLALSLPDAADRHVLPAAIQAGATVIVTFNLSYFPARTLQAYGIEPAHPDLFLLALFDDAPDPFLRAARTHRASLRYPHKTAEAYLETLRANRLTELALRLSEHQGAI